MKLPLESPIHELSLLVELLIKYKPQKTNNFLTILCPYHEEKTPSFSIDMLQNRFHCFGCTIGGSLDGLFVRESSEYDLPIDTLMLGTRTMNCLKAENIYYIGDLLSNSFDSLIKTPNLGRSSLEALEIALEKKGYKLKQDIGNWRRPK
jgi:Bacterial RNA polymerase, alpha chain C terminal domain/CHC2 zinc finger